MSVDGSARTGVKGDSHGPGGVRGQGPGTSNGHLAAAAPDQDSGGRGPTREEN